MKTGVFMLHNIIDLELEIKTIPVSEMFLFSRWNFYLFFFNR